MGVIRNQIAKRRLLPSSGGTLVLHGSHSPLPVPFQLFQKKESLPRPLATHSLQLKVKRLDRGIKFSNFYSVFHFLAAKRNGIAQEHTKGPPSCHSSPTGPAVPSLSPLSHWQPLSPDVRVLGLLVSPEVHLPLERLVAQFAGEWLVARVLPRVRDQVGALTERLAAHCALVGLLACRGDGTRRERGTLVTSPRGGVQGVRGQRDQPVWM